MTMTEPAHLTKTCTDCGVLFALPLHGLGPRCWDYGLGGLPIDSLGNFTCLECAAERDTTGRVARDGSAWDGVVAVDLDTVEVGTDGSVTASRPYRAVRWNDLVEADTTTDELTEECAQCGTELHTTKGKHGSDGDDIEFPFWRFVHGHVAAYCGVDDGCMVCRECVENGSDFRFSVETFEDGECKTRPVHTIAPTSGACPSGRHDD